MQSHQPALSPAAPAAPLPPPLLCALALVLLLARGAAAASISVAQSPPTTAITTGVTVAAGLRVNVTVCPLYSATPPAYACSLHWARVSQWGGAWTDDVEVPLGRPSRVTEGSRTCDVLTAVLRPRAGSSMFEFYGVCQAGSEDKVYTSSYASNGKMVAAPRCGDGVVGAGEQCDPGAPVMHCNASCQCDPGTAKIPGALGCRNPAATLDRAKADVWRRRSVYQVLTDRFARAREDGAAQPCSLSDYCGGSFKGLRENLDYIQGTRTAHPRAAGAPGPHGPVPH
eukprot:m51a1_g8642 putative glycoside hydrolase family 13 protein (284) ;mRNA; f:5262-6113